MKKKFIELLNTLLVSFAKANNISLDKFEHFLEENKTLLHQLYDDCDELLTKMLEESSKVNLLEWECVLDTDKVQLYKHRTDFTAKFRTNNIFDLAEYMAKHMSEPGIQSLHLEILKRDLELL